MKVAIVCTGVLISRKDDKKVSEVYPRTEERMTLAIQRAVKSGYTIIDCRK